MRADTAKAAVSLYVPCEVCGMPVLPVAGARRALCLFCAARMASHRARFARKRSHTDRGFRQTGGAR